MHPSWCISSQDIIDALKYETLTNSSLYIPCVDGASQESLLKDMNAYVSDKIFKTLYGDMVPQIVASALRINIIIVSKMGDLHDVRILSPYINDSSGTNKNVLVYKTGLHYDGLCQIRCDEPCRFPDQTPGVMSAYHASDIEANNGTDFLNDSLEKVNNNCYKTDHDTQALMASVPCFLHQTASEVNCQIKKSPNEIGVPEKYTTINIISWNINGLTQDKLDDALLGSFLKKYDVILLNETWASEEDDYTLEGFVYHNYPRKCKHPKSKRESGGLGIFINDDIQEGAIKWAHTDDIIAWIILKKSFFGFEKDVYLGNVYIVPEGSTYLRHDEFNLLYQEILKVPDDSEIALCGDYNARTGTTLDFDAHANGSNGGLNQLLPPDDLGVYHLINEMWRRDILIRASRDNKIVNKHGIHLLNLCKSAGMLILNGRIDRDKGIGDFTRDDTTGKSVVDYVISTPKLFKLVQNFRIHGKFPESDHRPISLSLLTARNVTGCKEIHPVEWKPHNKYVWSRGDLDRLAYTMDDMISESYRLYIVESVASLCDVDTVAGHFDDYITQACKRTFRQECKKHKGNKKGPAWYDAECRHKRALAIQAGERVLNDKDREKQTVACRQYRSCKQRKQRLYFRKCVEEIKCAYFNDRGSMWKVLDKISNRGECPNEPSDSEFYHYFKDLSSLPQNDNFSSEYETTAINFMRKYDSNCDLTCASHYNSLVEEIVNANFTHDEIESAIDLLKANKSPGEDSIPSEFIKACKTTLTHSIVTVLNYIIETRDFPIKWASGLRSAIFKNGKRSQVDNFRGITILPIIEKIFEIVVYRRLAFVNEAFNETDRYNGGFLCGSRTSDNIFVLNGLIERQLTLGKSLLVCFVDFSKAFDVINRNILFYKLLKNGWTGRVIDTLRSLYAKSHFRVKRNGKLSPAIPNWSGVNQGGISSGLLFRKYMADLGNYLNTEYGVVLSDEIIVHLLWADDLILFSDTQQGLQKLLNGLQKFCHNNHMVVNETKTKVMCFGKPLNPDVHFNGKLIKQVDTYKYLGNIIRSVHRCNQDTFAENYQYLSDQARKAIFSLYRKTKAIRSLPPTAMFYMFDVLIRPILTYGSDVWGFDKTVANTLDKVFLNYNRCVLQVKATTCNAIVYGECGKFPPSVYCHVNVLSYYHRLLTMPEGKVVKSVFNMLYNLNDQGFQTWATRVCELALAYNIDINETANMKSDQFKSACQNIIKHDFIDKWNYEIKGNPSTILKTYALYKSQYVTEAYLDLISNLKHRIALSKLRASSHNLEIERGRYTRPITNLEDRLCPVCHVVDNEIHFVTKCRINEYPRASLWHKINTIESDFEQLDDKGKFCFLMSNSDRRTLSWFGKYVYQSFNMRNKKVYGC